MMRRRASLGIAVGADAVRVVGLAAGCIVSTARHDWTSIDDLAVAIGHALDEVLPAMARSGRLLVGATIGPIASQVRSLAWSKVAPDQRAFIAELRENASRYFVGCGHPLVVAPRVIHLNDTVIVAAFDARVVEALTATCRSYDLRLAVMAPTVEALRLATTRNDVRWVDGPVLVDLVFSANDELESIHRQPLRPGTSSESSAPVAALASLGAGAWRFADAYAAAAVATSPTRLALVGDDLAGPRARSKARLRMAVAACAASIAFSAVSPGLAVHRAAARAERELAALDTTRRTARDAYLVLGAATKAIEAVDTMASGRRSMAHAIAALTRVIPESVFLKDLRLDVAGGTLVAIGPHAAVVVSELAAAHEIKSAALVGAVTPQAVVGAQFERATIRFQWARQ
jgi:hypothetical protein